MSLHVCAGCSASYAVGLPACPQCGGTDHQGRGRDLAVPVVQVACRTDGCRACDQVRRVRLAAVDQQFVQAPSLLCAACGQAPEIVVPWPPEGESMPKITKHGGPSNALADPPSREPAEPEEEVASSPGSSSRTSSAKDEPSPKTKPAKPQKRARTTGSRSKRARTDSSSASGTGGGPTEASSESG